MQTQTPQQTQVAGVHTQSAGQVKTQTSSSGSPATGARWRCSA